MRSVGRRTMTDSLGRYELDKISSGRFEVLFRRLGYQPFRVYRRFGDGGDRADLNVFLVTESVVLPEVETRVRGPAEVPSKLREWARRREFNVGGKFWDDSLLRTMEHRRLPELLRGVSGVRIIRGANGGRYLATGGGRGAGVSLLPQRDPRGLVPRNACYATILIDGIQLAFIPDPPNLDDYPINQIAAIEFYRSVSEMPAEFSGPGSHCGVLAIWTR